MSRRWRLTPRAEDALTEIARWTTTQFGAAQAEVYETELIARCEALAVGNLAGQDCSVLAGESSGLRFIRAGRHFVVHTEIGDELHLSVKTISTYRSRILDKMGMRNNAELMHYAIEEGIVS